MIGYDIIGDVHGHYDELINLINKLGYHQTGVDMYQHPDNRILIFVGDLIDRGPKIRETLQLVRTLVNNGLAYCIKGNHEYNAINFWSLNKYEDGYYRKHSRQNIIQHYKTILAFQNRDEEWDEYVEWMYELPILLDMPDFRVVHASYHPYMSKLMADVNELTSTVKKENRLITEIGRENVEWKINGKSVNNIIENVLKGCEVPLPEGVHFYDKEGTKRVKARTKWWLSPLDNTYDKYLEPHASTAPELQNMKVDATLVDECYHNGYPSDEKPIFFGHYWLKMESDHPLIQSPNVCCLDYSVAKKGHLVAYRFDGEKELSNDKFVYVESN